MQFSRGEVPARDLAGEALPAADVGRPLRCIAVVLDQQLSVALEHRLGDGAGPLGERAADLRAGTEVPQRRAAVL